MLLMQHRMVHTVHIRGDDEEPQSAVELCRQRDIGMIEHS